MNFTIDRTLEDLVFSTFVKFESNGTGVLTPEQELALINDFGAPVVEVGGSFTGNYKVDAGKVVEADGGDVVGVDCDEITFVLNSMTMEAKEGFEATYSSNAKKILAADYETNVQITTAELLAEARCKLFENEVLSRLSIGLTALIAKSSTFETDAPINRTLPA